MLVLRVVSCFLFPDLLDNRKQGNKSQDEYKIIDLVNIENDRDAIETG